MCRRFSQGAAALESLRRAVHWCGVRKGCWANALPTRRRMKAYVDFMGGDHSMLAASKNQKQDLCTTEPRSRGEKQILNGIVFDRLRLAALTSFLAIQGCFRHWAFEATEMQTADQIPLTNYCNRFRAPTKLTPTTLAPHRSKGPRPAEVPFWKYIRGRCGPRGSSRARAGLVRPICSAQGCRW